MSFCLPLPQFGVAFRTVPESRFGVALKSLAAVIDQHSGSRSSMFLIRVNDHTGLPQISVTRISEKQAHKLMKNLWDTGWVCLGHPSGQAGVYLPGSQGVPVV